MQAHKTIYQVDSFTQEPFKGNPAGVMFVDDETSSVWMQNMAMEMNLSETAFIIQRDNHFDIRYFTPTREVPLCGHATLASAHMVYSLGFVSEEKEITFKAQAGTLTIRKEGSWLVMNFPKYSLTPISINPSFKEIIGFEPVEMYASDYDWVIAIAATEAEIAQSTPQFSSMKMHGLGYLMITAPSDRKEFDFVTRCFAPISGIDEDPVTGSAHCALTPLWAAKLGKDMLNSLQISKRTGVLKVNLNADRVEIKGQATTIFEAHLIIQ